MDKNITGSNAVGKSFLCNGRRKGFTRRRRDAEGVRGGFAPSRQAAKGMRRRSLGAFVRWRGGSFESAADFTLSP